MATPVTRSPVTRECSAVAGRHSSALMVTLAPEGIVLREKGRRLRFLLPYGVAHLQAVRLYVDAERRARLAARKERAAARRRR